MTVTANEASLTLDAPAKINLYLAITGRRADGYHELVSVVAKLRYGDELTTTRLEGSGTDSLSIVQEAPGPPAPEGPENLVLRAADAFRKAFGGGGAASRFAFQLTKRLPSGAGLGGGSSDAATALVAMNRLCGEPLSGDSLKAVAADVGSDCPLFLVPGPALVRGRGERVEPLPASVAARLKDRRIVVIWPGVGIPTEWVYGQMAAEPERFCESPEAVNRFVGNWLKLPAPAEALAHNGMEAVVDRKYLFIPAFRRSVVERLGLSLRMSGSGSALYAILPKEQSAEAASLESMARDALAESFFLIESRLF